MRRSVLLSIAILGSDALTRPDNAHNRQVKSVRLWQAKAIPILSVRVDGFVSPI